MNTFIVFDLPFNNSYFGVGVETASSIKKYFRMSEQHVPKRV